VPAGRAHLRRSHAPRHPGHRPAIEKKRLRGLLALRAWLAGHRMDVINTHSSTDSWLTALACATLGRRRRSCARRHISAPVPDNAATRWLYTRATQGIVTTGEALKAATGARQRLSAPGAVVSVPTGIDLARFGPAACAEARRAVRAHLGLPARRRASSASSPPCAVGKATAIWSRPLHPSTPADAAPADRR
jgi:hypothetical protein